MGDENTNAIRDALIIAAPWYESTIRSRDEVVNKWCSDHGVDKDSITVDQLLEIRALPEWQNAS